MGNSDYKLDENIAKEKNTMLKKKARELKNYDIDLSSLSLAEIKDFVMRMKR